MKKQIKNTKTSARALVHAFFEEPRGVWAWIIQGVIIALILASVVFVIVETFAPGLYAAYVTSFEIANATILAVFTVEYCFRIATATRRLRFAVRPLNVVDFLAIFPNYLEIILPLALDTTGIRVIRLLRPLRLLRIFKLLRYGDFFSHVVRYRNTILESITPVLLLFVAMKSGVWALEKSGLWFTDPSLGELFTIIGFALGIVLSQKITSTHDKFVRVEETTVHLYGSLDALRRILNALRPKLGNRAVHAWATAYIRILEDPTADPHEIRYANATLHRTIHSIEHVPDALAILSVDIQHDADFCLAKKHRLTPQAYDTLIHQATILYLLMLAVFLPGATGMISVIVATYILYGMYHLTRDLDSIMGGDFNLTSVDITELKRLALKA